MSKQDLLVSIKAIEAIGAVMGDGWVYRFIQGFPTIDAVQYTDDEIQRMQDIEQAQIQKAYDLGYAEGKADAVSHWIPCSERLPEEKGQYLITVKYKHVDGYDDIYAEHGEWYDGKWDMFCFGHCGEVEDIIAWMPLPKPYERKEE